MVIKHSELKKKQWTGNTALPKSSDLILEHYENWNKINTFQKNNF